MAWRHLVEKMPEYMFFANAKAKNFSMAIWSHLRDQIQILVLGQIAVSSFATGVTQMD